MHPSGQTREPHHFSASAYVLLAFGCNPGPKNAPAPRSPLAGRRRLGGSLPRQGDNYARLGSRPPQHGLKARAPQQAGKVCWKGSSRVPLPRVLSSTPWFQPALESGTRQAPGRSRGCLRVWVGGGCPPELPQSPSVSRPSCPPAVRTRPPGGHRQTAGSAAGPREAPAQPWGPEEGEGRAEWLFDFGFLQLPLPSSRRESGAGSRGEL